MNISNNLIHGQFSVKTECWSSLIFLFLSVNIIQYTFKLRVEHSRS